MNTNIKTVIDSVKDGSYKLGEDLARGSVAIYIVGCGSILTWAKGIKDGDIDEPVNAMCDGLAALYLGI